MQVEGAGWSKASLKDGTTVQLISWGYADGRVWVVSYRDDGTLQMLNRLVGKSIEAAGANRYVTHQAGDNVQIWSDHDGPNQRWTVTDATTDVTIGGETYPTFYLKLADENLRMAASASTSGSNIVLASPSTDSKQKWAFVPIPKIVSGAVYKLVSYADSRLQLAVYNGWQKQNGNGVGGCTIHDEWNDQKWLLEGDDANGWTLTNLSAERYAVVKDAAFQARQPVIAWSDGSTNKIWSIYPYSEIEYGGGTYPVVAFGAGNGNTYALEYNGSSTAFIDTWGSGIIEQRWILVPTWGFDNRLSAPYDIHAVDSVGKTDAYTSVAPWGSAMEFHYVPYWKCASSIATSGGTSFQYRSRNRKMNAEASTWEEWSDWEPWQTVGATRDGDEWWGSATRTLEMSDDYKMAEAEFEVRTCVAVEVNGESSLRYGATGSYIQQCYPVPSAVFGDSVLTANGIEIPITSDYDCGSVVLTFDSLKAWDDELLDGPSEFVVEDGEGKVVIPYSSMARIPASGSTVDAVYSIGSDQKAILEKGLSASSALSYGSGYTAYTPTITDDEGRTKSATAPNGYVSSMWMVVDGRRIDCPKNPDGTFQIAYPFGVPYELYAAGSDSDGNFYVWNGSFVGERGMHAWSWGGGFATLELNEGDPLTTDDSIDTSNENYLLDSRPYETVTFAPTRKHKFTATGSVVNGVTESTRRIFEDLPGKHCTYRSPHGDIVQVAVISVSRETHKRWAEINVSMIREG